MKKVLCFTSFEDISTQNAVAEHVRKMGAKFFLEKIDDIDKCYSFNTQKSGYIFGEFEYQPEGYLSVWHRRCGALNYQKYNAQVNTRFADENSRNFFKIEYESMVSNFYQMVSQHYWVNSIHSRLSAQSKLKNLKVAAELGLKTPDTIISNAPDKIKEFAESYQDSLLVKPFNSFEIVESNRLFHCVARKISLNDINKNIKSLGLAPVFLQNYVEKKFELRVTIVGESVFTVAIFSQLHPLGIEDWRCAPLNELKYEVYKLPESIEKALIEFNSFFGLEFSVFDLIVSKDGEIYFLECNPDGEWYWLEMATGLPISRSLADRLISNASRA